MPGRRTRPDRTIVHGANSGQRSKRACLNAHHDLLDGDGRLPSLVLDTRPVIVMSCGDLQRALCDKVELPEVIACSAYTVQWSTDCCSELTDVTSGMVA